ncbi:MAG TPA: RidA family protein [Chloroflexota bacterium]|nr:RidA family protein [Chloroflexota bacterium]
MTPPARIAFTNPPTLPTPPGYTQVVVVTGGRTIYIAGQVALDPRGVLVGAGDLLAQTRQVFINLQAALTAAGATFADVVKLTYYLLDAGGLPVLREVRDSFVNTASPPASTLVEVRRLAREEFLIEIEAIASVSL